MSLEDESISTVNIEKRYRTRIAYAFMTAVEITTVVYCINTISTLGFPDGHLTELERFSSKILAFFSIVHALAGLVVLILFFRSKKTSINGIVVSGLIAIHIVMHSIQYWASTVYNHGQGG